MDKALKYIVIGLAGLMVLLLVVVFFLILQDVFFSPDDVAPTRAPTAQALAPTATPLPELPPPALDVPATFTPLPTSEATDTSEPITPEPTDTPAPTNTLPPSTPTNTPVPLPTNTSAPTLPPPPTNTSPPPAPPPQDTRGLVSTHFALQDRSDYRVNKQVWFEFIIVNNTGGEVPYSGLGVLPRKGGTDRGDWFQQSYGGSNATIKPQGLDWEDNIKLPESGTYTLRLVICFESVSNCVSGQEPWITLSQEIPVTIS